ncbi:glycoprotein-N-acetylgalactosamine 3-beta-galactosyltransferase 1-like isoform X5 [Penaeus chinensis]|uniref:glycoprotein-N-acetylgalactosamine 3-beta-galactosyltransferase 1-like isoform X5 n=1 Tax=Penaeus chinensis TaxID=139456 RepID=UPI001FB6B279|nr:glycoprotein-N-acetylgalactosamine 3-beta-galactosyltransferase 1-like isoform X5 [Penaeus chinensis]
MAKVNTNVPTNPSALAVGFLMLLGSVLGCVFTLVFSDQFQMSTKLRNWRENQMSVQSLRTLQHGDEKLGAVALNTSEGYYNLWGKTKAAFRYVYEHHLDEYDWFLKADDDTYTIMENMRYMLCSYDPKYPIYFGSKFRRFYKEGFLGGGSGYVLSREATRKLVEEAMSNKTKCKAGEQGLEDVELAACLLKVGVLIGDSRDSLGRGRFFPLGPDIHIMGQTPKWYKKYAFYKPHLGLQGCSETAIAFHRVPPEHMYWYDFLLYYVRAYGVKHEQPFPPQLPPDRKCIPQEILEKFGQTKNSSIV